MSTSRILISLITLIFGLMLINEWNIYFYKPPKFHELKLNEGTICLGILNGRYGRPLCLLSDSKKIIFKSKLRVGSDDGYMRYLNSREYKDLLNKNYKIWWREETYLGFSVNRLYQLEVDGELFNKIFRQKK